MGHNAVLPSLFSFSRGLFSIGNENHIPARAAQRFSRLALCAALAAAVAGAQSADEWMIETVAGSSFVRDGGPAVQGLLYFPQGAAADGAGNLYIADTSNHRIRKVDAAGNISTVAGTGQFGYSGDGGPAAEARLMQPRGIAADGAGNLYIADADNHRIRKVDVSGVITTVAGTGAHGYSGDGDTAAAARLHQPWDVAADRTGNLYIADAGNHRIRKVDAAGYISTAAGTGDRGYGGDGGPAVEAQLDSPASVAADEAGNIYIADGNDHRVRKVDASGVITTAAGTGEGGGGGDGGPAVQAKLNWPQGVSVDSAGNLYIADTGNHRIRRVDAAGYISTAAGGRIAGDGSARRPALYAHLLSPSGMAADGLGNLYIADTGNHRIRKVDAAGNISTTAGPGRIGDGGTAVEAWLYHPGHVAADGAGNLYIADTEGHRIRKVDAAAGNIFTVAGTGSAGYNDGPTFLAQFHRPEGIAVDGSGNLHIADSGNHYIRRIDTTGRISLRAGSGRPGYFGDGMGATQAGLHAPRDVATGGSGNFYIADTSNHRIRKVDAVGYISTVAGTGERGYSGDGGPAIEAQLAWPSSTAADEAGNLYIADSYNHRIRKVDTAGNISTAAGIGTAGYGGDGGAATAAQLNLPQGVAVDGAGNVYIADSHNNRIRKVDAAGNISTVAGTGWHGYSGDGGSAVEAQLAHPRDVAVDGSGNIYIADSHNRRIRRLTLRRDGPRISSDKSHIARRP